MSFAKVESPHLPMGVSPFLFMATDEVMRNKRGVALTSCGVSDVRATPLWSIVSTWSMKTGGLRPHITRF